MQSPADPFRGPVPPSVPLPQTPLTGVLVQVRFNEILAISKVEFVAGFQEKIRAEYPVFHDEDDQILEFSPVGTRQRTVKKWRFFDAKREWRLTLTTGFVAIETRNYENRHDLARRVERIVTALSESIEPNFVSRIGVRYVDRVYGEPLSRLEELVRAEMVGILRGSMSNSITQLISELSAKVAEGSLTSRWGYMPSNATHEPELMQAISVPSWFLDIDVYKGFDQEAFDVKKISQEAFALATRAYGFFRWVVTDEFIRTYGGEL